MLHFNNLNLSLLICFLQCNTLQDPGFSFTCITSHLRMPTCSLAHLLPIKPFTHHLSCLLSQTQTCLALDLSCSHKLALTFNFSFTSSSRVFAHFLLALFTFTWLSHTFIWLCTCLHGLVPNNRLII